jgi:hypothetical protein
VTRAELVALIAEMHAAHPGVEFTLRPRPSTAGRLYERARDHVELAVRAAQEVYLDPEMSVDRCRRIIEGEIGALMDLSSARRRFDHRSARSRAEPDRRIAVETLISCPPWARRDSARAEPVPATTPRRKPPERSRPPVTTLWERLEAVDPAE